MTLEEQIAAIEVFVDCMARIKGIDFGANAAPDGTVIGWARIKPKRKRQFILGTTDAEIRAQFFKVVTFVIADVVIGGPQSSSD